MNFTINRKGEEPENKRDVSSIEITMGLKTFLITESDGVVKINKAEFNNGKMNITPVYVNCVEIS